MKVIVTVMILFCVTGSVFAQEIGRYQAVAIPKSQSDNSDNVFVIDTKEGHLWVYRCYPTIPAINQKGGRDLIYSGKVKPGKKIGDIIDQKLYD